VLRLVGVAIVTFAAALVAFLISLRLLPVVGSVAAWLAAFAASALAGWRVRADSVARGELAKAVVSHGGVGRFP
jgi:hypothetical protein